MPRRLNIPRAAMLKGTQKGHETQRRLLHERLRQRYGALLTPLADRVPMAELIDVAIVIDEAGRARGYASGYNKLRRERAAAPPYVDPS